MDLIAIDRLRPIERRIKDRAYDLGFDLAGIGPAAPSEHADSFLDWLRAGHHAGMSYMERNVERRLDIRQYLPCARSVIMVGVSCRSPLVHAPGTAIFAMYALHEDYHDWIKRRLKALASQLAVEAGRSIQWKAFVDTAPVLEREHAVRAGLGWIGKNTMLINRRYGSHVLLGGLVTDLELQPDPPAAGRCGLCTRCIAACPTGAIVAPYVLDARRCIAYHTIESRDPLPASISGAMGNRIFGCDICQEACPFNNAGTAWTRHDAFRPRAAVLNRTLTELASLSDDDFRRQFLGSPVRRAGAVGLRRNAGAALSARSPESPE